MNQKSSCATNRTTSFAHEIHERLHDSKLGLRVQGRRITSNYGLIQPQKTPNTRLLVVHGTGFVATAQWSNASGSWRCVNAGHPIEWMRGATADYAKTKLEHLKLRWTWGE